MWQLSCRLRVLLFRVHQHGVAVCSGDLLNGGRPDVPRVCGQDVRFGGGGGVHAVRRRGGTRWCGLQHVRGGDRCVQRVQCRVRVLDHQPHVHSVRRGMGQ